MSDSITSDLFAALNILVLERLNVNAFRIIGTIPNWLERFCSIEVSSQSSIFIPQDKLPFLSNFLIDAEEFWQSNFTTILKSGICCHPDLFGKEGYFEASAICLNERRILLVELLEQSYQEKQNLLQKARENKLKYQQLQKENQKNEVLIHCILHDIVGQLSGINYCFALLEMDNLSVKGKEYLEAGKKQSMKQEMLIREILDTFSAEVNLNSFTRDPQIAPDALASAQDVIQLLQPSFTLNKIKLQLVVTNDEFTDWKVVGEKSRLERAIANIVENALRYSPTNSTVSLNLHQDEDYIMITVDDEGSGVPPDMVGNLFQKFSQGKDKSGRLGLGLYFCRITVERWGGEVGYSPRPQGGSRFWLRLPKPTNS